MRHRFIRVIASKLNCDFQTSLWLDIVINLWVQRHLRFISHYNVVVSSGRAATRHTIGGFWGIPRSDFLKILKVVQLIYFLFYFALLLTTFYFI